ncbi:hypothetical protein R1flu_018859 [Riccia fluitans]|uniref:RING-type domain-containing protein n=1 Tax=Riccia fluitans TaxID=41844 RepID=A0ABD1ZH16_9MARC
MALLWFCRYEEALGILEKDYPNGKEAVAYIKAIDLRKFSRYALVLPRYGRVTSNVVECMNAAFLKLREYAARRLLFEVWIYVMRSFYERRTTAEGSIDLLTEYAKGRLSEFEREYGRYVTYNADDDNALVQTNGGVDQWIVRLHPRLSCSCYEPQEMQWPCIRVMSWCKGKGEDYLPYVDKIYFQKSLLACYSQAIPPVTEQDLVIHITCRAPEVAVHKGRARTVRIPNGGGSSRRHREYMYPVQDEARLISSQGPLIAISDQAVGPSTQDDRGKSQRRCGVCREIESELEGPSSSQGVLDPDASTSIQCSVTIPPALGGVDPTVLSRQLSELLEKVSMPSVPLQVLESQQKTCEDLINRLVEAGGTIAGLAAELKQKDCEVAALKERLQGSEQKLQREEARNAWLNKFTSTLTSELQTLRTEGMKAKLTGKVPDRDWLHEAKQRWRAHPTPENLFRLTEALEEHKDQILVREKMFLKHAKYLTVTIGDEEAPPDISKAAVVLCRRNDVLYTSAERQEQLDRPFTSFPGWNCAVSSEGGTINVPEQFRGGTVCSICQQLIGPSGAYLIATCPHIFHLECLVRTMRQGQVKCPNCRIPFHRDMMRKFYMERIAPLEHAATYFGDPVQLRRRRLILPFLFDCLDRYITMFEGEMPLEHRKEMLSIFFKEVDTKFPDSVLDAEDRYPGPYDLRAELKHLLSFYLRREIADREEIENYM